MLKKQYRIRKQREFDSIFKAHKKIRSENFQALIHFSNTNQQTIHNNKISYPRFAFVVSKKVGNAPTRNKVKRKLREIVREELPTLKTNFEIVFVTYPQIHNQDYRKLQEEVRNCFRIGNLYKTLGEE